MQAAEAAMLTNFRVDGYVRIRAGMGYAVPALCSLFFAKTTDEPLFQAPRV